MRGVAWPQLVSQSDFEHAIVLSRARSAFPEVHPVWGPRPGAAIMPCPAPPPAALAPSCILGAAAARRGLLTADWRKRRHSRTLCMLGVDHHTNI